MSAPSRSALARASRSLHRSSAAPQVVLPTLRPYSTPTPSSSKTPTPKPTNLPGSNLPAPHVEKYSPLTVSIVKTLAKLFGYNSQTSTAIRSASDYYDRSAERGEVESAFFYGECGLPPSFQTWFSITTLHLWLLTTRLRALPAPLGQSYTQELLNHFFVDLELRIRGPYGVTNGRLVKGYMNDMLAQYRGAVTAYDEALLPASTGDAQVGSDAVLAAALWRNLWGAGWGTGGGGVKGKKAPKSGEKPTLGPDPTIDFVQEKLLRKGKVKAEDVFVSDQPLLDPGLQGKINATTMEYPEMEFVVNLERLVRWTRTELSRLEKIEDSVLTSGETGRASIVEFTKI